MTSNIHLAIKYWFKSTIKPNQVFREFQLKPHIIAISTWICLLFAILYSLTAFLLYITHTPVSFPQWVPIANEVYYLYQTFWTVPWGLVTWIMISGISHILAITGKNDVSQYKFDYALAVNSIAFVVPWFYLAWLPETFIAPFFGVIWPSIVDLLRMAILAPLWQTVLTAIGLRQMYNVGWAKSIGIGVITVAASFMMFMPYIR